MFPIYLKLTDVQDEAVLIPLTANPVFEQVTSSHPQLGHLVEQGMRTAVRVGISDEVYTFKVKEDVQTIGKMITDLVNLHS
jgi:hypothetical protein